jgi:uncharacterized membrane protein
MEKKDLGKTSTGMQANVAALVSYVLGWITGLIFFLIEKDNKFVRFHALQSIIVFGAVSVLAVVISVLFSIFMALRLGFLYPIFSLLSGLIWLAALILWIILMIKAYQGEHFKLPIAGDIAEKNS